MVQQQILGFNGQPIDIHIFALLIFAAAVAGDSVGFEFGHKVGRKLFQKENSRFFKKKYLDQTETFYAKHASNGKPVKEARAVRHISFHGGLKEALEHAHGKRLAKATRSAKLTRSEERRVGKKCRSRWSPYH